MNEIQAALFDVDGVLINAPELFSHIYAKKYALNTADFDKFFTGDFLKALTGEADLKELILQNRQLWEYEEPDEILDEWFEAENYPDAQLVQLIQRKRREGLKVFITTDNEKYRARFIFEKVFPGVFDGIFASSEIGFRKVEPQYWDAVKKSLGALGLKFSEAVYFDDGQHNIDMATESGLQAYLYTGIDKVKEVLA